MFWSKGSHADKESSSWSITARLVVLYTASAAIILSLTTGFLYWVLQNNVENADRRFLNDKIEVLKSISKQPNPGFERLKEEVQWEVEAYQFNRYYARVLSPDGSVLIETPKMSSIISPKTFTHITGKMLHPSTGTDWESSTGERYLLMHASTPSPGGGDSTRRVQIALNISSQQQILSNYLQELFIVLSIAIVFSAAAGAFVARKGMRPLSDITTTVKRISASELHERTHPGRWPAELSTLAGAFDKMLDRLEASFNRLRQFSADLAHELRTPISNLVGETEVTLSKARSPEEYRKVLESNLEEYNRLSILITNLLFLAKADNTSREITATKLDGRKELNKITEFYEVLASEKHIRICIEGRATVKADPDLFRRAVGNILSNAIQYAPEYSVIELSLVRDNGKARISIKDEGPGIPQEHIPKLFDRFYRVDNSRSTKLGGTGLGLPIVKSITDLHNGDIRVESKIGQGTTVRLVFPSS